MLLYAMEMFIAVYSHSQKSKTMKIPIIEWTNKMCYIHALFCYTIIKRINCNNIGTLKDSMLNEVRCKREHAFLSFI